MIRRSSRIAKTIFPAPKKPRLTEKMSTFNLPDTEVPVKLVDDLSKEELLEFPGFKVTTPLKCPSLVHQIY
jgi:hypothetical protein